MYEVDGEGGEEGAKPPAGLDLTHENKNEQDISLMQPNVLSYSKVVFLTTIPG